jgi:hypothetical protein
MTSDPNIEATVIFMVMLWMIASYVLFWQGVVDPWKRAFLSGGIAFAGTLVLMFLLLRGIL